MKFCCGITLYYPSNKELLAINEYTKTFDYVYIFDNTDDNTKFENKKYFENNRKIVYICDKENEGLSVAYNVMCKSAIDEKFDYICLFDQDSLISNEDIVKIKKYIDDDESRDVAVYTPEIIYKHKEDLNDIADEMCIGTEIEWNISSGSFINLSIYKNIGGFDENYFIDRLDYDYCYTAKKLGYKIIKIKNVFLYQSLGENIKKFNKSISQHSEIRHYYMFRNRLYFYLKKDKETCFIINLLKVLILSCTHISRILLYETKKLDKLKMISYSVRDFSRNNMKKYKGN